jgi:hypothetical protein
MFEMNEAERLVGEPAFLIATRAQTLSSIGTLIIGTLKHMCWFVLLMPALLLGRLATLNRFKPSVLIEAIAVYGWWLALCSLCWPVLALKHADTRPRITMRFWWLRFRYLLAEGKLFLSVVEKEALFIAAGTAEENLALIFSRVETAAAVATGQGRRLAFASFIVSLFSFGGFSLQPAFAQTAQTTATDSAKAKPTHVISGFLISSMEAASDHQTARLDYARVVYKYMNGRWMIWTQADPTSSLHLKWGFIGYDDSSLSAGFWAGRIVSPYAWAFDVAMMTQSIRTPLDNDLGVPFFDNGIEGHISLREFALKVALLNGSGDYSDNNGAMDLCSRLSYARGKLQCGATIQRGMQPYGQFRELNAADLALTISSFTLKAMAMERPDLKRKGIMTSVVCRAGPLAFSTQGEYVDCEKTIKRYVDGGVTITCSDKTALLLHMIGESGQPPKLVVQLKRGF